MTVGELLARCSSAELAEWQAFYLLEAEDREREELDARARAAHERAKRALR